MTKNILTIGIASLLLASCSKIPSESYYTRGAPESLLDASSEVVTLSIGTPGASEEFVNWMEKDQPSRVEIYCANGDPSCAEAEQMVGLYGIEYEVIPAASSELHLIYERVLARDCENRYIDNRINPYNLNHPTFGCSIASNMVQMVSDKREFASPALLDYMDGKQAVKVYDNYVNENSAAKPSQDLKIEGIALDQ